MSKTTPEEAKELARKHGGIPARHSPELFLINSGDIAALIDEVRATPPNAPQGDEVSDAEPIARVDACAEFENETIPRLRRISEDEVAATFAPLQAALTALVDDNHRLKFEMDGVNIGETKKWLLRSAKAEATLRLVHRMMPIFERGLEQLAFTAETGGEIWADMRRIQELLSGHTAESWAAMEPVTALTFFEDSALNVPTPSTPGIEPEQGGNHG